DGPPVRSERAADGEIVAAWRAGVRQRRGVAVLRERQPAQVHFLRSRQHCIAARFAHQRRVPVAAIVGQQLAQRRRQVRGHLPPPQLPLVAPALQVEVHRVGGEDRVRGGPRLRLRTQQQVGPGPGTQRLQPGIRALGIGHQFSHALAGNVRKARVDARAADAGGAPGRRRARPRRTGHRVRRPSCAASGPSRTSAPGHAPSPAPWRRPPRCGRSPSPRPARRARDVPERPGPPARARRPAPAGWRAAAAMRPTVPTGPVRQPPSRREATTCAFGQPAGSGARTLHRADATRHPVTGHAGWAAVESGPRPSHRAAARMIDSAMARIPGIDALPQVITVNALPSVTLAILLLFVGKGLTARINTLRRYSIPEPVVGGVLCAAVVCALYYGMGMEVHFELGARDMFLLYFFAALGLNSNVASLRKGGWKLVVLLALAGFYIVFQNLVGMGLAGAFGMDPRAGLMVGSVSLTGGVGTTIAWTPHFVDELGIANAGEIGLASNMVGMIAACVVGGPIAGWLISRYRVTPSADSDLEVGTLYGDEAHTTLDYTGVLLALFW